MSGELDSRRATQITTPPAHPVPVFDREDKDAAKHEPSAETTLDSTPEEAARRGDPEAQYKLGMMYLDGRQRLQDYVLAHMWFNLAASQGHGKAQEQRDSLTRKMSPEQLAEAQSMAREWEPR